MVLLQRAQIAAMIAVVATPVIPAAAATPTSSASIQNPYCSTRELSADQLKAGVKSTVACFATMADSLTSVGVSTASLSNGQLSPDSVVTGLVGVHYASYGGTGTSLVVAGEDCNGGGISFNQGDYWNDIIRSTRHEGCSNIKHWVDANESGAAQLTNGGVGAVRDMNATLADKVSSIAYYGPVN